MPEKLMAPSYEQLVEGRNTLGTPYVVPAAFQGFTVSPTFHDQALILHVGWRAKGSLSILFCRVRGKVGIRNQRRSATPACPSPPPSNTDRLSSGVQYCTLASRGHPCLQLALKFCQSRAPKGTPVESGLHLCQQEGLGWGQATGLG